ncbi:hypothetical protein ACFV5J_38550 [Streptomyces zaomyceticus]|uniref:hypothetical protein n=1 Tax=Streptomyces TaxID=1883 RepID=UPI0036556584
MVDRDHQPRLTVEVVAEGDAALQRGAEADQSVVNAGDVAAVRDRRQAHRPQVGDANGVEDQAVGAVVEELGGEVRRIVVLPVPVSSGRGGQHPKALARAGVCEAQQFRERGRARHRGGVPLLCCT